MDYSVVMSEKYALVIKTDILLKLSVLFGQNPPMQKINKNKNGIQKKIFSKNTQ